MSPASDLATERSYDSRDGIAEAVRTLDGIGALVRARIEAGYDRKERMSSWCVLGRIHLDTCGNALRLAEGIPPDVADALPSVLPFDELFRYLARGSRVVSSVGLVVPTSLDVCAHCGSGWSLRDWHTAVREDSGLRHAECAHFARYERAKAEVAEMFQRVGYEEATLRAVPNGYCSCDRCPPWWLVDVGFGAIQVGRRKRVYSIDWSRCALRGVPDFSAEDVTKWPTGIHAWSADKAVEYLREVLAHAAVEKAPDHLLVGEYSGGMDEEER